MNPSTAYLVIASLLDSTDPFNQVLTIKRVQEALARTEDVADDPREAAIGALRVVAAEDLGLFNWNANSIIKSMRSVVDRAGGATGSPDVITNTIIADIIGKVI